MQRHGAHGGFLYQRAGHDLKKGFDLPGYGQHFFFDMGNGSELAFFWFNDAVTGADAGAYPDAMNKPWLQSFYFLDPDGIMLEFCADLEPGLAHADLPVNAQRVKSDGSNITGL